MINILANLYNFHEDWAKEVMSGFIYSGQKVLIIAFSFGDELDGAEKWDAAYHPINGLYYSDIIRPFLCLGIKEKDIFWLNYFTDTHLSAVQKIKQADVLFFTGGLPDRMMARLIEFDLTEAIENFTGVISGISAGAMIQIRDYHISPDDDYAFFSYNKGLNMITDFDIEVHYNESDVQKDGIKRVLKEKGLPVYVMKNDGALIVKDGFVEMIGNVRLIKNEVDL